MLYKLDIYKWGLFLLPPVLRKKRLFALLAVLLRPFHDLLQAFKEFRKNSLERLDINGQVAYIEKALNGRFLLEYREIYLTDTVDTISQGSLLYPQEEETMAVYGNGDSIVTYLKSTGEGKQEADFIVNVPSFLSQHVDEIKTIVEYNKPAGRSYEIKIYDYE